MSLWERIKCNLLGKCATPPPSESHQLIDELRKSVAVTTEIRDEIKDIRESGIWPQDMVRGTYRVNRRTVRRDNP